jgi:Fe-S-cluster containining protein
MTRRSDTHAQLQALYDQIPAIPDCDGSCWTSCGPLDMSDTERARLARAGYRVTPGDKARMQAEEFWCEALTDDRRCAVYDMRPLVCRLWGATEDRKCPFGCIPEGGWLTADEGWRLIIESRRIGDHAMPGNADIDRMIALAGVQRKLGELQELGEGGARLRTLYARPAAYRRQAETFPCPHCGFMLTVPDSIVGVAICGNCRKVLGETHGN